MNYFRKETLDQLVGKSFTLEDIPTLIRQHSYDAALLSFLNHIQTDREILFLAWVSQLSQLEDVLTYQPIRKAYKDLNGIAKHPLFGEFKRFITPFLFQQLNAIVVNANISDVRLTYFQVLDGDARMVIEHQLYKKIQQLFENAVLLQQQSFVQEELLIKSFQNLFSSDIIGLLNAFSPASYQYLIDFTEKCYKIIKGNGMTPRLANWILKQLQQLHLNGEHLAQLDKVSQQLASGEIVVQGSKKSKFKFSQFVRLPLVGTMAFLGIVIFLIVKKPFSEVVEPFDDVELALEDFTLEERKYLDSLVKVAQPEDYVYNETTADYDSYRELYVSNPLAIKNVDLESFYQKWRVHLSDSLRIKSECVELTKKHRQKQVPSGFLDLELKQNGVKAVLKNDTDFDMQIIVFNNEKNAKPYYILLKKQEYVKFSIIEGEYVSVVSGLYPMFLDESNMTVFCHFNESTYRSLNTFYECVKSNSTKLSFVLTKVGSDDFELFSLQNALKKI